MADDFDKEVEETKAKLGVEEPQGSDETDDSESDKPNDQVEETEADQQNEDTNEEEGDSTDNESDKGDESDDEKESSDGTFKKRFTQFKGDSPEEYIPNLEDAYWESSKEAVQLAQDNKALAERVKYLESQGQQQQPDENNGEQSDQTQANQPADPLTAFSRKELKKRMDEDFAKFKEEYPIVDRDPEVLQKLDVTSRKLADMHLAETGEYMDLYDLLKMSAAYLNLEPDKSEEIASAAKDQAAMGNASSGSKKPPAKDKSGFTEKQLATAKKFGLTKEQLAEHNN